MHRYYPDRGTQGKLTTYKRWFKDRNYLSILKKEKNNSRFFWESLDFQPKKKTKFYSHL